MPREVEGNSATQVTLPSRDAVLLPLDGARRELDGHPLLHLLAGRGGDEEDRLEVLGEHLDARGWRVPGLTTSPRFASTSSTRPE